MLYYPFIFSSLSFFLFIFFSYWGTYTIPSLLLSFPCLVYLLSCFPLSSPFPFSSLHPQSLFSSLIIVWNSKPVICNISIIIIVMRNHDNDLLENSVLTYKNRVRLCQYLNHVNQVWISTRAPFSTGVLSGLCLYGIHIRLRTPR